MRARFDSEAYDDALFDRLEVECTPAVRVAVRKRKAEYLAGRHLCGRMLAEQGFTACLRSGHHRQPLWPPGAIGSITHASEIAMVALADDPAISLLGIDYEPWLDTTLSDVVAAMVIDAGESGLLDYGPWPSAQARTLAFSAKESLFKAAYPEVGAYFDFDRGQLTAVDWSGGHFAIRIRGTLSASIPSGRTFLGVFQRMPDGVFTAVADPFPGAGG